MAPVPVKCIISFSSQDAKHPAENLVKGFSVLKWLGSLADGSGRLEATFQLQNPCVLFFLFLANIRRLFSNYMCVTYGSLVLFMTHTLVLSQICEGIA